METSESSGHDDYPADIRSVDECRRWDMAVAIAIGWYGPEDRLLIRMTARSLFDSEIET